jgi:hypothetical protein
MTPTAPSKPWRLHCLQAADDPASKPPRGQATRYLDRLMQHGYQWLIGHPGRTCRIQHADADPADQAAVTLDVHGRMEVSGDNHVADAVRRLLTRGVEAAHLSGLIPNHDAVWRLRVDGLPDTDLGWRELYRPARPIWGGTTPVVVARELARSWQPHDGVAVITHLTAGGELQVRYSDADGYLFSGRGQVPDLLGFHPANTQPTRP